MVTENPYQPPKTSIGNVGGKPKNSIWWKAFFWLTLVLMLLSAISLPFIDGLNLFDYADFMLSVVSVVGLYGFCFYRRLGNVVFWRYFFYVVLVESIIFSIVLPIMEIPRYGEVADVTGWYIFEIVYTSLLLWAIYRYAYKVPFLWERA